MALTHRTLSALVCLAVSAATALPAAPADKVSVLIIDGQNGHDWKATTPVIKDLLTKTGRFNVDVLTSPPAKAPKDAWDKFRPEFGKYAAVVINYAGQPWPDEVQKAFEKYVAGGGGVVAYHFAVSSWPEWEAWNQMIGLGWRDAKFGDRLYLDDAGKEVRQAKGTGPGRGHGPAHVFEVTVRDANDPIMKGMPAKWAHAKDELYHGQRGPAKDMHILATAFSAKDKGGTGCHEPVLWTVPFGNGRVFTTLLGHDGTNLAHAGSAAAMGRGTEWAATGKVTIAAPKEIAAPRGGARTSARGERGGDPNDPAGRQAHSRDRV